MKGTGSDTDTDTDSDVDHMIVVEEDALQEAGDWYVDHINIHDAIVAMADRQPQRLEIHRTSHDVPRPVSTEKLESLAKAARNCIVELKLYDTFLNPKRHEADSEALQHFLDNSTLRLLSFVGHLDPVGIKKLPNTLKYVGLSINSVEDSLSISKLKRWKEFQSIDLTITKDVAGCNLRMAPNVSHIGVHFPHLADDWVDRVKGAIERIRPDLELNNLVLPKCQLSAAGIKSLVEQLRGTSINGIEMEMCGAYQPDKKQKESLETELLDAFGCNIVSWSLEWLH